MLPWIYVSAMNDRDNVFFININLSRAQFHKGHE